MRPTVRCLRILRHRVTAFLMCIFRFGRGFFSLEAADKRASWSSLSAVRGPMRLAARAQAGRRYRRSGNDLPHARPMLAL